MEEKAQEFADFLAATEEVSEGSDTEVIVKRNSDSIAVTLDGFVDLTNAFDPWTPEDPKYARFLDDDLRNINETFWLARFFRIASEVIMERNDDGMRRLTLVFRD